MGYKKKSKTILVQFEPGHDLYGLEARLRGLNIGDYLAFTGFDGGDGEGVGGSIKRFAEHLMSWNLEEEDGTAVPTTLNAVMGQDHDLIMQLSGAWLEAMAGVHKNDPLPESSHSGEPSLVESVPMEALSPSLAS